MKYEDITKVAFFSNAILWCVAALTLAYGGRTAPFSFGIVGVLAILASAVAVNSARREGVPKMKGPINRFLGKVGR